MLCNAMVVSIRLLFNLFWIGCIEHWIRCTESIPFRLVCFCVYINAAIQSVASFHSIPDHAMPYLTIQCECECFNKHTERQFLVLLSLHRNNHFVLYYKFIWKVRLIWLKCEHWHCDCPILVHKMAKTSCFCHVSSIRTWCVRAAAFNTTGQKKTHIHMCIETSDTTTICTYARQTFAK